MKNKKLPNKGEGEMRASLKVDTSGRGSATPSKQRRRSTMHNSSSNKDSSNGAGDGGGGGREDSSMEALEAQRYLQTTLPRFLENIDDAYKVPFNFKLGEGNVVEKEETAMLVPLGSFNPVPKILSAIQSDDLEDERAALRSDCDSMDQAMQIIVDAYYNGFNKSLASYGHILRHISTSKESVRLLKAQLADIKTSLNIRNKELRKLWLRKAEYSETTRILDEIEEVKVGWELVERHTQAQSWVPAARVLIRCARIVEQDEMRQIGAIYDIRLFVLDLYHKFHTRIIEELHQVIYLKHHDHQQHHQNQQQAAGEGMVDRTASVDLSLSRSQGDVLAGRAEPTRQEQPKLTAAQLTQRLESLVESLCIVKRVKEAVEALSSRVGTETRSMIDAGISGILIKHQEKRSAPSAAAAVASTASHAPNSPLENLLRALFEDCVKVLLNHKRVVLLLRSFCAQNTSQKGEASAYTLAGVWEAMQEELITLLRIYLAASSPSADSNSNIADAPRRKLFRFADSSAATYNVTGAKEGASALAALQLLSPSPYNLITVYPLLRRFQADVLRSVLEFHEAQDNGRLLGFMDEFVEQVYLPHVRHQYRTRLNQAVESPDAFKPRERQRAANGEVHNWPRSVVYCVGELATMIRDAARAMAALPAYAHHLAQVVEDLCLSFQRRCTVAYEDATESSLAARIVSNSLVPAQLAHDPLWNKLLADIQEEEALAKKEGRGRDAHRALGRLSPRSKTSPRGKMSPRRRQASVLEAEPESEGGWATYLYEGEDKFCRDNPIARTDLLLDSGRLLHLCHLTESLEWLVEELESMCTEQQHQQQGEASKRREGVADGWGLRTAINQFTAMANRCLFVLKVEVRLHAFYFLDGLQKCSYVVGDETPEPDGCIVELTKDLGALESILSRVLPEHKVAYVLGGLEGLVASIVVRTLPKVKAFNPNGVWKMCRNVFALEQSLSQLGYAGNGVAFEAARRYYRLLTLPPDELVAHLLRPSSSPPAAGSPSTSSSSPGDDASVVAGQGGRAYYAYTPEEYKALLAHLDKSPAYRHVNFDALLKTLAAKA